LIQPVSRALVVIGPDLIAEVTGHGALTALFPATPGARRKSA
jgi:hypothetical protein